MVRRGRERIDSRAERVSISGPTRSRRRRQDRILSATYPLWATLLRLTRLPLDDGRVDVSAPSAESPFFGGTGPSTLRSRRGGRSRCSPRLSGSDQHIDLATRTRAGAGPTMIGERSCRTRPSGQPMPTRRAGRSNNPTYSVGHIGRHVHRRSRRAGRARAEAFSQYSQRPTFSSTASFLMAARDARSRCLIQSNAALALPRDPIVVDIPGQCSSCLNQSSTVLSPTAERWPCRNLARAKPSGATLVITHWTKPPALQIPLANQPASESRVRRRRTPAHAVFNPAATRSRWPMSTARSTCSTPVMEPGAHCHRYTRAARGTCRLACVHSLAFAGSTSAVARRRGRHVVELGCCVRNRDRERLPRLAGIAEGARNDRLG